MKSPPLVDWTRVDTVMLDMDGTILDLHFDNQFWAHHLPKRYAEHHQMALQDATDKLAPIFSEHVGRLNWYCTDFWSDQTSLDIVALKREISGLIGPLPGAVDFLDAVRASGKALWLVTNAHPASVELKLERTGLAGYFGRIITSHEFGCAKEEPGFWKALLAQYPFTAAQSLFVDDSPAVVEAAAAYGLGQVVGLSMPDSRGMVREHSHGVVAERLVDLLPLF